MNRTRVGQLTLQKVISLTLRIGVLLAGFIGVLGGALFLLQHGQQPVHFSEFVGVQSPFASSTTVLSNLANSDDAIRDLSIIQLAIIVLMLTPILRVAFSIVAFALERDRLYVAITSIVLVTLLTSVLLH